MTTYTVLAPYVTARVKDQNGETVTVGFYESAVLPDDTNRDDLDRLIRKGLVADSDSKDAELAAPAGTPKPGEPPNVPVTEIPAISLPLEERLRLQREAADAAEAKKTTEPGNVRPKLNAPKPEWVAYAVSKRPEGQDEAEAKAAAEDMTKAELIAMYDRDDENEFADEDED